MRITYFSPATASIEETSRRPSDVSEATAMVAELFKAGIASLAQILRDDGWVLQTCAPLDAQVLSEAPPGTSTIAVHSQDEAVVA